MKKFVITVVVISFFLCPAAVKASSQESTDSDAIKRAALDYMDGAHAGDAARMERAVHPELNKIAVQKLPQTGKSVLRRGGSSRLIQLVGAKVAVLDEDKRNIQVKILDVLEGLAMVKVTSAMFWDYLQLAKIDGEWKIINVLYTRNPQDVAKKILPEEEQAIEKAALDYIEGSFSGDASRMERAVHPELNKVIPVKLPQTGKTILNKMGATLLIEGTRARTGLLPEEKRKIRVTVLDIMEEIAMVKVLSAMYYDYLQMAKVDGQWKIINVLWVMNPDAPPPAKRK
ncbi:MAG: nuclear transport factor 2 family protein [Candidatus Aminicenantes bacterium]|nr:MAG: nuclear transport factor 2 family protein [Candidatus Aminicenantes bacterium]